MLNRYDSLKSKVANGASQVHMYSSKTHVNADASLDCNEYVFVTVPKSRVGERIVLYMSPLEFNRSSWRYV